MFLIDLGSVYVISLCDVRCSQKVADEEEEEEEELLL